MPGTDDDGWLLAGSSDVGEITDYYDRWATDYDGDLDGWTYRAPEVVAALVTEHAPDAGVVLDAGCGTGLSGRALRAAGLAAELHGVDVSTSSLEVAGRSGVYTSLAPANLQEPLVFESDRFDALVCVGVMTYVPDVEACWREFCRVVRPGGVIVVTQREDLWEPRDCAAVVERVAVDGAWEVISVSGPEPYLPGNDDYADRIGVHYVCARVR